MDLVALTYLDYKTCWILAPYHEIYLETLVPSLFPHCGQYYFLSLMQNWASPYFPISYSANNNKINSHQIKFKRRDTSIWNTNQEKYSSIFYILQIQDACRQMKITLMLEWKSMPDSSDSYICSTEQVNFFSVSCPWTSEKHDQACILIAQKFKVR